MFVYFVWIPKAGCVRKKYKYWVVVRIIIYQKMDEKSIIEKNQQSVKSSYQRKEKYRSLLAKVEDLRKLLLQYHIMQLL